MADLIRFPAIDGVTGTTCGTYSHSYFSGCTDDQGITRGFTQEWYFDGGIGGWLSVTKQSREFDNLNIVGQNVLMTVGNYGATASFSLYDRHFLGFQAVESGTNGATLTVADPPAENSYAEMTLIVDNPSAPDYFSIAGKNISGADGTVHMDRSLTSSAQDGLTFGIHMWKIWTIDGGDNYYVYRANGFGRFWDDS